MAFLGLVVPERAAQTLATQEVEGERIDPSVMHVTMLYLGKEVPIDDIVAAIRVVHGVVSGLQPFECRVASIGSFPANPDDGVPVIGRLDPTGISDVRAALKEAFDAGQVPYSNKYPDFKPHVTLAYSDTEFPDRPIEPVVWTCSRLTMWCGDRDDDGMNVEIPLGGKSEHVEAAIQLVTAALRLERA